MNTSEYAQFYKSYNEVAEYLHSVIPSLETILDVEEDHIKIQTSWSCWGQTDYEIETVPLEWIGLPLCEFNEAWGKRENTRKEEKKKAEEKRKAERKRKEEERDKKEYERLKAKFDPKLT